MMLSNYICALDIGSSKISAAVAKITRKRIGSLFLETLPSKGVKNSAIVDSLGLIDSIERILKNLKTKSGINIKTIYTNISGPNIVTKHSSTVIALAERGNKVITLSDIQRVNEEARILGSNLEEEIIHIIPFNYCLDSKQSVLNPVGLYSHRLEADLYLISGRVLYLQNLYRAINQAGYEIKDIFFSGFASARTVLKGMCLDERGYDFMQGVEILCDIGSDTTEILIYNDGRLKNVEILPVGGADLTVKLSEELKIPFDLAEDVKITHAQVGDYSQISEDREVLLKKNNIYKPIKQKSISEILTAEANLICQSIKEALEKNIALSQITNFVVIGRTVLLEGFLEMLEHNLRVQIKLGRIVNPDFSSSISQNNTFASRQYLNYISSLGIISLVLHKHPPRSPIKTTHNLVFKTINRFKEVYQEYF